MIKAIQLFSLFHQHNWLLKCALAFASKLGLCTSGLIDSESKGECNLRTEYHDEPLSCSIQGNTVSARNTGITPAGLRLFSIGNI